MFNYYIFNKSYEKAHIDSIEDSLRDLNDLVINNRNEYDFFLKHESIWNVKTADGDFSDIVFTKIGDEQLRYAVLPRLFQSIEDIENEILSFEQFDSIYETYNAFYGVNFYDIDISRCITNTTTYSAFREKHLWDVTPTSFWERKEVLFSRIIFCDSVEKDIIKIGGTYLKQILKILRELEQYIMNFWTEGNFSYNDANAKAALNISPESNKTMEQEKFKNQRIFSMPDGRRECFELHIKTGNLRFHFFPEKGIIYIGYIGQHLDTAKFN